VAKSGSFSQNSRIFKVAEHPHTGDTAPLGYYTCSVDAKGRLKVPADFLTYMRSLGAQFFLTSYDELDIQIYTRDAFLKQCDFLEDLALKPDFQDDAEDTLFRMRDLGADVSPDPEGRILLPPVLRQRLKLTDLPSQCHIGKDRDHLVVMTAERYESLRNRASQSNPAATAKRMRQIGLR
jgi:DNA-binding transcriptional regulator/RsmH inhibitor MraZ